MKKKLLCILVICPMLISAQLTPKFVTTSNGRIGFYEFKPPGYNPDSTYEYPLIIFLHGVGERGNGTTELPRALLLSFPKLLVRGATMKFTVHGRQHAFLILIPQMSKNYSNWQNFYIDAMIEYANRNLKIDRNKIFLTGWSLGGGGAWKYATSSLDSNVIAGIIPVSPAPDYTNLCNIAKKKIAVWVHHAKDDGMVPVHFTDDAIEGIQSCFPDLAPLVTYYPSGGHSVVGNWAYDTLNNFGYPNIYQWMIGTSRVNTLSNNKPPVPIAGPDTSIIVPSLKTILNGSASYDPNDVIVSYNWAVISGPSISRLYIEKPDSYITNVSGLVLGDYIFRLTVKDQFGAVKSDDATVHVSLPPKGKNALPLVDGGPDVTISSQSYHLEGKIMDFDGSIKKCSWRQISGPVTLKIFSYGHNADILGLTKTGTYGIELVANDNNEIPGVGRDTLFITKTIAEPAYFWYFPKKISGGDRTNLVNFMMLSVVLLLFAIPPSLYNYLNSVPQAQVNVAPLLSKC